MRKVIKWSQVRVEFETGSTTITTLCRAHRISRQALYEHLRSGKWNRAARAEVMRRARQKLAEQDKVTAAINRGDKRDLEVAMQVIEQEAAKVGEVLQRHRDDWSEIKKLEDQAYALARDNAGNLDAAHLSEATKLAQLARMGAETLTVIQDAERKLYRLDEPLPEVGDDEIEAEIDRFMLPEATA